ncbi:MAG: hypothetical protein R3C03_08000 [Pirellulaceae bacterium]
MGEVITESPDDPRIINENRPVSVIAIVAFLLGLSSIIALVNNQFVGIAALAALVALIACLKTEFSKTKPVGALAAQIGLLISGTTLTSIFYHQQIERDFVFSTARKFAEQWLDDVRDGNIYSTYQLTLEVGEREPIETDLMHHFMSLRGLPLTQDMNDLTFNAYKHIEPEASMRRAGGKYDLEFVEFKEPVSPRPKAMVYPIVYRVNWHDPDKSPWTIEVGMQRIDGIPPYGRQWSVRYAMATDPEIERKLPSFAVEM